MAKKTTSDKLGEVKRRKNGQYEKGGVANRNGGRPPGSPNKTTAEIRQAAIDGTKGFARLIAIANGQIVRIGDRKLVPDTDQVIAANRVLIGRVMPNLVAQHIDINAQVNVDPATGAKDRLKERLKNGHGENGKVE